MTPIERLEKILQKEEVDRPLCICPGGMMNMITTELLVKCGADFVKAHTDATEMAKIARAAYENGCFENVGVPFCMTVEAENFGAKVDMGSNEREPHVIRYAANDLEEAVKLTSLSVNEGRTQVVVNAVRLLKEAGLEAPVIGNLTGPISTASSIVEPSAFYKGLRKKPELVHEFLEMITNHLIAFARAMVEAGADVIAVSDPSGTGEIMGPKYFEEYTVAYLNKLLDGIRDLQVPTFVHICGQMRPVLPIADKISSDVLSFDAIVPMKEAREILPDRILMGNVSTYAIEGGDVEKVAELTKKSWKDGANILAPACGLGMGSPLRNVQAILRSTKGEEYV